MQDYVKIACKYTAKSNDPRYILHHPFLQEGKVYASDGSILICFPEAIYPKSLDEQKNNFRVKSLFNNMDLLATPIKFNLRAVLKNNDISSKTVKEDLHIQIFQNYYDPKLLYKIAKNFPIIELLNKPTLPENANSAVYFKSDTIEFLVMPLCVRNRVKTINLIDSLTNIKEELNNGL